MADKNNKVPENTAGSFYVDTECIGCETCIDIAEECFEMNDENLAYVSKQPENEEEEKKCREALEACPSDAIGDDG